jgi:cold shock CspA family protein/ribosome-associated translation inhibitor RaiA
MSFEQGLAIEWSHAEGLPEEQRLAVEDRLRGLAEGQRDLIAVSIAVRGTSHHRHGGQEVRVAARAHGRELVALRQAPDAALALDAAVDAFERELRSLRERRRGSREQRVPGPPHQGIIDRVLGEEGYGFILTDAGERVYFHRNAVRGKLAFDRLSEGDRVALEFEAGREGLQATAVVEPPPGAGSP